MEIEDIQIMKALRVCGKTYQEISDFLNLSPGKVKRYITNPDYKPYKQEYGKPCVICGNAKRKDTRLTCHWKHWQEKNPKAYEKIRNKHCATKEYKLKALKTTNQWRATLREKYPDQLIYVADKPCGKCGADERYVNSGLCRFSNQHKKGIKRD
jgi:hypothetical protein